MSKQWNNNKVGTYLFSKVTQCLEQKICEQIDCKRQSSTKQMKRAQDIRIKTYVNRNVTGYG